MKISGLFRLNDRGVAVFVSLIILFVITIAGVSIIVVASKDKMTSANVAEIRNVAFAAKAALSAYESQCGLQPAVVRGILNKYKADTSYKWLLVSDSQSANSEKKYSLGTDGLSYSAMITAFDKANRIIQVTGNGYGRSNAKKSITAIYKLTGIDTSTTPSGGRSRYGLYCAGNAQNFDAKMNIVGDVYVGQAFTFNGSGGMRIQGNLKTGYNPPVISEVSGALTVDGSVYIGSTVKVSAPFTCNAVSGNTAMEGKVTGGSTFTVGGDLWMNDTNIVNRIVMSGKTLHHSGHIDKLRVTNAVEDNRKAKITGLADTVGLIDKNDSAWTFLKAAELIAMARKAPFSITASTLQAFVDGCPAANSYNGYAVMSPSFTGFYTVNPGTGTFNGRVIMLVDKGMMVNGYFPDMTTDSRILIYAYSNANISDFAGFFNSSFNGMIFAVDNSTVILGYSGKTFSFRGALHYAGKNVRWQLNGGATMVNITYDESIVSGFESIGLIRRPSGASGGAGTTGNIILNDLKIKPELAGILY